MEGAERAGLAGCCCPQGVYKPAGSDAVMLREYQGGALLNERALRVKVKKRERKADKKRGGWVGGWVSGWVGGWVGGWGGVHWPGTVPLHFKESAGLTCPTQLQGGRGTGMEGPSM